MARATLALLLGLAYASGSTALAQGGISISPTRVVMEGRVRTAEVLLLNRRDEELTMRVFMKYQRMTADGGYEEAETLLPEEKPGDELIRYSPRQVTIPPRGSQTVRLLLRKPADLAPGEYRTHLFAREVPKPSAGTSVEQPAEAEEKEISVKLIPVFALSIPVLVRHGEVAAGARVEDLSLIPPGAVLRPASEQAPAVLSEKPAVAFALQRQGNGSVRGDVDVRFLADDAKEPVPVGLIKGLGVLYPLERRQVRMDLSPPEGLDLRRGKLLLRYEDRENEKKPILLSAAEVILP